MFKNLIRTAKNIIGAVTLLIPLISFGETKIVAIVNDTAITSNQLEERKQLIRVIQQKKPIEQLSVKEKNDLTVTALNSLINYYIALPELKAKTGSDIPKSAVEENVKSFAENNNMTVEQLSFQLRQQDTSLDEFKEFLKSQIVPSELTRFEFKNINVSEDEMENKALQEQNFDADIELEVYSTKDNSPENKKELQKLWKKVKDCGCNLSKNYTNLEKYNLNTKLSKLSNQIQPTIRSLSLFEKSTPIEVDGKYKFYILCKKEIIDYNKDNKDDLHKRVFFEKSSQAAEKLMTKLKKQSHIQFFGLPQAVTDELQN